MRCLRKDCERKAVSRSSYCGEHKLSVDMVMKFAGNISLNDFARTLAAEEHTRLVAMVSFEKAEDGNLVYFEPAEPRHLSPILLFEVKPGESAEVLKAQQRAVGKKFIFQGRALVDNKITEILAFR